MRFFRVFSRSTVLLLSGIAAAVPACDGDDDDHGPLVNNLECSGKGGPVKGPDDDHCIDSKGDPIVQSIGECSTGAGEGGAGGAHGHEEAGAGGSHADEGHEEDEEHPVLYGSHAADDDCKYDVAFTTTCVEVNKPVTFTLTLKELATGKAASGAKPASPEVFLADDPSHISPSINIKAPEDPDGTYAIGPILFDRSGRWVIRFHYFETCSDVTEDSPHGHAAFYIDVP